MLFPHSIDNTADRPNPGDYTEAAWWSTLEIHIGIICACLPAVRHLFISLGATILRSTGAGKTYGYGTYGSSKGSKGFGTNRSDGLRSNNGGGDTVKNTPKHGDEGDFVPLVEYPGNKAFDKGGSSYSVGVSHHGRNGPDSV